jgi:uncharacterized phiE125 gp8 family phage protein
MKELVTAPAELAVSLDDVKAQIRMETSFTAQDTMLTGYINAAIAFVEGICGRKLINQTWLLSLEPVVYPPITVMLPFAHAQSITSVVWKNQDGDEETIDADDYELIKVTDDRTALRFADGFGFSEPGYHSNPLSVTFVTGYGDTADDIPADIRLALLLAVSHYYTNGLPTLDADVELALYALLRSHRLRRQD